MDAAWENAIKRGDLEIVLDLLARGIDVDARDRHGQTAVMLAAHAGHREVVEILVAHRANLHITAKFGLSALMLALVAGMKKSRAFWRTLGQISRCGEPVLRGSLARQPMIWQWNAACWNWLQS
ncbi:MAG: ankyrin repeat domain-containing protein [Gammaproteobacteria bacterium]